MTKISATQYLQHALYLQDLFLLEQKQEAHVDSNAELDAFETMQLQEESVITATSCAKTLIYGLANFRALAIIWPLSKEETENLSTDELSVMASRASMNAVATAASVFLLAYSAAKFVDWYFEIGKKEEKINNVARNIFQVLQLVPRRDMQELFLRQMKIYKEDLEELKLGPKKHQTSSVSSC